MQKKQNTKCEHCCIKTELAGSTKKTVHIYTVKLVSGRVKKMALHRLCAMKLKNEKPTKKNVRVYE